MTSEQDAEIIFERIKKRLDIATKLGVLIIPNGSYATGYDMSNLPPHPVGLIGALTIVEGTAARSKLGLNYKQSRALELGFINCGNKNRRVNTNKELEVFEMIGKKLGKIYEPNIAKSKMLGARFARPPKFVEGWGNVIEAQPLPQAAEVPVFLPQDELHPAE